MVFGLCEGVLLDLYFPQFPTFRHITHLVNSILITLYNTLHTNQVIDCNQDRRHTNPYHTLREYKCITILPQLETAQLKVYYLTLFYHHNYSVHV